MPEWCANCAAVNDDECLCPFTGDSCEDYFHVRNRNCPLVPIPQHGDLIDRTRIVYGYWGDLRVALKDIIERMPTIIPAEEE